MSTAVVIYRSRSGTTRRYGEEIGAHLRSRGLETRVVSIGECDLERLREADLVLLGCWTNGLMVVLQHPDQPWLDFARDLPPIPGARVGLFTTYKLATGSMFSRMRAALAGKAGPIGLELKSRSGGLSDGDRRALDRFIETP